MRALLLVESALFCLLSHCVPVIIMTAPQTPDNHQTKYTNLVEYTHPNRKQYPDVIILLIIGGN